MLSENMVGLLNTQVNKELESAYLYLEFANYFVERGLTGFAHWYRVQAKEEVEHAEKFIDYLQGENEKVVLTDVTAIPCDCKDDVSVLEAGLAHEVYVTDLINTLCLAADDSGDYRTKNFLAWFVEEQAEEERNANELIDKFKLHGEKDLYELDHELGKRNE